MITNPQACSRPPHTPHVALVVGALATLTAASTAQGVASLTVSPPHFAAAEGNSSGGPFGTGALQRWLQIHDDLIGQVRVFRGIAVRPDALFPGTRVGDYSLTLSMWMSTASRRADNIRPVFDENHGADKTLVIDRRSFNLPGAAAPGAMPRGWTNPILFDHAFSHAGLAGLTWEVETLSTTIGSTNVFHDAASGSNANPLAQNTFVGTGCRASGRGTAFTMNRSAAFNWPAGTGTLTLSGSSAPASAPVFMMLGASDRTWNGIPLPFLIPGSGTNASGPCRIYSDVLATLFTASDASGLVANTVIPIGMHPGLHGLNIVAQLWAMDAAASFGLVTSRAAVTHFVAPFGAVPVSKLSQTTGGSPQIALEFGLVLRFNHD